MPVDYSRVGRGTRMHGRMGIGVGFPHGISPRISMYNELSITHQCDTQEGNLVRPIEHSINNL